MAAGAKARAATPAAKPRSKAPAAARAKAAPPSRPRPVGASVPSDDPPPRPVEPPSGAEVLESAVRAAGELAQVGATIGRHTVKSVLRRLRP